MLSFVIAEEDLQIETSYPFSEVTAVFLLNNPRYHQTSHRNEPLSYHIRIFLLTIFHTHYIGQIIVCCIKVFYIYVEGTVYAV